jgi:hypothetical protein
MPLLRDDSQWPVVVDTSLGQLADDDLRRYNEARAERLARAERHVQVMDGRGGVRMTPRHRKMIGDFDRRHRDAQRRYLAGVAMVTTSPLLLLLLTAIYRLTPAVYPRKACRSFDEAASWAGSLLRDLPRP